MGPTGILGLLGVVGSMGLGAAGTALAIQPPSAPAPPAPAAPVAPATPDAKAPQKAAPEHARARLIADVEGVKVGETFTLGVVIDIDKGWHIYWPGSNDSGAPTRVSVELPKGFEAGEIQWPAPVRHVSDGDLLDYVYEGQVTLLLPVKVGPTAKVGEKVEGRVKVEWLVCSDGCIPGSADLKRDLPAVVKDDVAAKPTADAKLIAGARARVPEPAAKAGDALKTAWAESEMRMTFKDAKQMAFMPGENSAPMKDPFKNGVAKGDSLAMTFTPGVETPKVEGVLEVTLAGGKMRWLWVSVAAPAKK